MFVYDSLNPCCDDHKAFKFELILNYQTILDGEVPQTKWNGWRDNS